MLLIASMTSLYLDADAALQFELQADHVHLRGGAQQAQLGHLHTHLVYGHLDGAQVGLVLVHDGYTLLHIRETMGGCRGMGLREKNRVGRRKGCFQMS